MPPEGAAGVPAELPRLLPAPLKLLRTLKFCEDASPQPRTQASGCGCGLGCRAGSGAGGGAATLCAASLRPPAPQPHLTRTHPPAPRVQEAHQLCDMGLLLAKAIADRLRGGKGAADAEPARFPGQVVLPRMCFRPNLGDRSEWRGGRRRWRWRACVGGLVQGRVCPCVPSHRPLRAAPLTHATSAQRPPSANPPTCRPPRSRQAAGRQRPAATCLPAPGLGRQRAVHAQVGWGGAGSGVVGLGGVGCGLVRLPAR